MGFRDVSVLRGGIEAWIESGRALARGPEHKEPLGYEQALNLAKLVKPAQSEAIVNDSSVTVLDVGGSIDYQLAHLPGAKWLSRGWLELKLPNNLPKKILRSC